MHRKNVKTHYQKCETVAQVSSRAAGSAVSRRGAHSDDDAVMQASRAYSPIPTHSGTHFDIGISYSGVFKWQLLSALLESHASVFLARDVMYTSRAYATKSVSVCLSVCL